MNKEKHNGLSIINRFLNIIDIVLAVKTTNSPLFIQPYQLFQVFEKINKET